MKNEELIWKNYHHKIYQIYHGFIAFTLVPFALLFLEWDTSGAKKVELDYSGLIFILTSQLLWIVIYVSWYAWRGSMVGYTINENMSIVEKLKEFQRRSIYKFVLLAIGGATSVLAMWIQPSFIFVLGYFAVLIQYSFIRPSEDKIVRDMKLSKEDREKLHSMK